MREIKFRGIPFDDVMYGNSFVYGSLSIGSTTSSSKIIEYGIHQYNCYPIEVKPETIGQYIGLKDKNGVEIYEGDILENRQYVCYREDLTMFCTRINEKSASTSIHCNCEIIGNIHQHKELLEGK